MFVYTFWEPREKIPFYLQLCMETWKKFLPNATIIVLDYKNIGEFLDVRELGLNLFSGRLSLPQIADAIRVALLAKHGGVWLDIDTIILSRAAEKYFLPDEENRTIFFGDPVEKFCHIAFINAPPLNMVINLWYQFIREKILNLKEDTVIGWNFIGNSFINNYAKIFSHGIKFLDRRLVIPELDLLADLKSNENAYLTYYFLQNRHLTDINADMLLLHNSWTQEEFKNLSPGDFFRFDCTMVNVLTEALEINLPSSLKRFRVEAQN